MDAGSSGKISSASDGWYGPTVDVMTVQSRYGGSECIECMVLVYCRPGQADAKDDEILPRSEMSGGPVQIEARSI